MGGEGLHRDASSGEERRRVHTRYMRRVAGPFDIRPLAQYDRAQRVRGRDIATSNKGVTSMPSNLPPGVTPGMIDRHFGGDDDEPDPVEEYAHVLAESMPSGLPHAAIARVVCGFDTEEDFVPAHADTQEILTAARKRELVPPGAYMRGDDDEPLVLIAARALIKTEFID